MFKSFNEDWPPPRWEPKRPEPPKLGPREQKVLLWLVGANLLLLLLAPIAGASLIHALIALFAA